ARAEADAAARVAADLQSWRRIRAEPEIPECGRGAREVVGLDENDRLARPDAGDAGERHGIGERVRVVVHAPAGNVDGAGADVRQLEPVQAQRTIAAGPRRQL